MRPRPLCLVRGTRAVWRGLLQSSDAVPYRLGELTRLSARYRNVRKRYSPKLLGVPRQADCMWVRNNKGNVFVGNLPPDFSDDRLAETFDPFGIVLSAIVARDPATGARLRYGFVDIATERAATKAIEALDGSEVDGCKLNVKPRDKAAKKPAGAGAGGRKPPPARADAPEWQGAGVRRRVPAPDAAGFGRTGTTPVTVRTGREPPAGRGPVRDRAAAAPRFRGRAPADPPHDRPEDISGRAPPAAAAGLTS